MPSSRVLKLAVVVACALGLAACAPSHSGQQVAGSSSAPAASAPATGQHYQASVSLVGQPEVSVDGKSIVVAVHVTNTGTGTYGSETQPHNVNLAAHSIDATGKIVDNDLARGHLPQVEPGAVVTATIKLPVGQLLGKRAEIMPVQEGVAWFNQWGTKPLIVGPFEACSNVASGKVCDAAGKPLTAAPSTGG